VSEEEATDRPGAELLMVRRTAAAARGYAWRLKVPVQISGHAIDRASQRCLDLWLAHTAGSKNALGLFSWLQHKASEAVCAPRSADGLVHWAGIVWVFVPNVVGFSLQTLWRETEGL